MIQWILQIIMEAEPDLARVCMDASNAFGDMERPCIRAALEANVALQPSSPFMTSFTLVERGFCGFMTT